MTVRYWRIASIGLAVAIGLLGIFALAPQLYAGQIDAPKQDGVNAVDTWSALGDRVWNDADGQGDQDGSELGINGVVVRLYNGACSPSGDPIAAAVTSGDGKYLFTYLTDGNQVRYDRTYCVAVDSSTLPSGFASTTGGHTRTVSPWGTSNAKLDVDFGYKRTSSLGIVKTVNPTGNVNTGQTLNYQVVVSNPSAINQTGIEVTDNLPAGVSYVASSTSAVGPTVTSKTVKDTFASQSYGRQDGPDNWSTNWIETDPSGTSAGSGRIYISSGQLRLTDYENSDTNPSIYRQVDLSGYSAATLSFDWSVPSNIDTSDGALVEISNNGGSSYTVLETFVGYNSATGGSRSYNIDGFISSNTRVRFRVILNIGVSDEYFAVDNVQIAAQGVSSGTTTKDNNAANATPNLANGTPPNLVAPGDGFALKPGHTLTINFQATVTAGAGTLINTAYAKSNETPNPVQSSVSTPVSATSCPANSPKLDKIIGGINLGKLTDHLFFFADAHKDANWQGATKGFVGNVAVDGTQAAERTSGTVPYAGTISTNDSTLDAWQSIVNDNAGQAFASTGNGATISQLETTLNNAFTQINGLSVSPNYGSYSFNGVSSTSLNGLNTADSVCQTFVINVTSGLQVSSQINITGDACDVFIMRWDSDANFADGYEGQVKFQSGGAIVPLGGLAPTNFVHVAGDINASGGGSTPAAPYPQGPRLDDGQGALCTGCANFSGGGFFTGYWLTTGSPTNAADGSHSVRYGDSSSLSNGIFVGGWYSINTKFSMTSGTSGVYVSPNCATLTNSGQIGDRVWYDLDSQGDQDASEIGINGVAVNLYSGACGPTGSPIQTKVTSGDGNYLFSGLTAGTYCVAVDTATLPAPGFIQTNSGAVSNPKTVTIGSSGVNLDIDFGYVANQCLPTIDFETDALGNPLAKGQVIDNEFAGWGITVSATANPGGTGPAMIFDSAAPSGGDSDLGTPNQSFSGPGVGAGGAAGMPGENSAPLGKILIVSENGSTSNPNDAGDGGVLQFTFTQPLRVDQVQVLDIDNDEAGGTVKAYNATSGGTLLATGAMLGLGDNSFQIVPLNATGVRRLEVSLPSSGALPAITFCGTPPTLYTLGDRIWHDTDEDGHQDGGELGIANVKMELLVGTTLADTTMTNASGIYNFTNLPAGNYIVRVASTNFNSGQPLNGYVYSPKDQVDDAEDSDFDPNTGAVNVNLTGNNPTIDGGFFQNVNLCYAVADGTTSSSDSNQKDTLAFLNRLTGATAAVGSGTGNTNRYSIEAIAFQPGGSILFAADAGQLGTLNLTTGAFTAKPNSFGSGNGSAGSISFNDVDGLTFDPTTGFLYGTHRRGSDPDVLFRIDPATGQRVNDAFGSNEYVVVASIAGLEDVDDIAVDPVTGVMYAILNNGGSSESRLVTVNKSTGATTSIGTVNIGGSNIQDIEGLAFFNDGNLYGSSGKDGPTTNALYQIDKATAVATLIGAFTEPLRDFEALECLSAPAAIVVEKSTNDEDADDLPGPTILAGDTVTWTYYVVNTGGVTLNNVVLTDDKEGTIACPQSSLASGASMSCVKTGVASTGQYTNIATVTGVRVDNSQPVQDTDPSHYNGVGNNPDYVITKVNNTDPQVLGVRKGEMISFTIHIENVGDVPITLLPLRDTYVDGLLTYSSATPPPDAAGSGQIVWNDLTASTASGFGKVLDVGQSFDLIVEFVGSTDTTALPGEVTYNTATVYNAFYDPDGPGGLPPQALPEKSARAPAKVVSPTAVELVNTALEYTGAEATIRWQTVNESSIMGFYLHRSINGGAAERITSELIRAQVAGQTDGSVYSYTDRSVEASLSYQYELEIVSTSGSSERSVLGILRTGAQIFLPSVNR